MNLRNAELALIRGSNPMAGDVSALFRGRAEHYVLPRTASVQIASTILECFRQEATFRCAMRGVNAKKVDG